jgi:hypothetical protein
MAMRTPAPSGAGVSTARAKNLDQHTLGDFQLEPPGTKSGFAEPLDERQQIPWNWIGDRLTATAATWPRRRFATGLAQDHSPIRMMRPLSSASGMNVRRN